MATVYGVQATKAFTGSPEDKARVEYFGGHIQLMADTYEASLLENSSDIFMGVLPAGAVLEGGRIVHDAMGAGVTLAVLLRTVDDGTDTTLVSATAADSAGTIELDDIDDVLQLTVSEASYVIVQSAGAASTGTIKSQVRYTAIA